jgi:hypothetical protein
MSEANLQLLNKYTEHVCVKLLTPAPLDCDQPVAIEHHALWANACEQCAGEEHDCVVALANARYQPRTPLQLMLAGKWCQHLGITLNDGEMGALDHVILAQVWAGHPVGTSLAQVRCVNPLLQMHWGK